MKLAENLPATPFNKELSNEKTFIPIHLAGQWTVPLIYLKENPSMKAHIHYNMGHYMVSTQVDDNLVLDTKKFFYNTVCGLMLAALSPW